eukprot:1186575-Prorocentrum_minimum.AAC.4
MSSREYNVSAQELMGTCRPENTQLDASMDNAHNILIIRSQHRKGISSRDVAHAGVQAPG